MTKAKEHQISQYLNRATFFYYSLMVVSGITVGIAAFFILNMTWVIYYGAMFSALHIAWLVLCIRSNYATENVFIAHYYLFIVIFTFPATVMLWEVGVYSIILLYILLPLTIQFRYLTSKYTLWAIFVSVAFIVAIIVFAAGIHLFESVELNQNAIIFANIFILIAAMGGIQVFLYYHHKILSVMNNEAKQPDVKQEKRHKQADNERLKELYKNVILHFEKNRPYCKSNYRLAALADDLNVGTKYLSDAINANYGENFETLLNNYRLEYVKQMLDNNFAEKYTMEYIYSRAGYSSRTTFYENFRKKFKMSPNDYIKLHKSSNIDV